MKLKELVTKTKQNEAKNSTPIIFDLSKKKDVQLSNSLINNGDITHIIDDYEEQQREYYAFKNPKKTNKEDFEKEFKLYFESLENIQAHGKWVYFPWISTLSHILDENEFFNVRTSRNRYLITEEEQKKFNECVIGIAGLSVGNSVALSIVLQGGAKNIKLADYDELALSNLNRIRAGVNSLGVKKVYLTSRQIYLLNPYANITIFKEGLNEDNIKAFFSSPPSINIMVDEVDNLYVKFLIREQAKKHKIPVIMGADNSENSVIDIERYDTNENTPFFHNRFGSITKEQLKNLSKKETGQLIGEYIGKENISEKMFLSLSEMGNSIVSWPQLGGAALLNGVALSYCAKMIANNHQLKTNRAIINIDSNLSNIPT